MSTRPKIGSLRGDELTDKVYRFQRADKNRIQIASDQVARAHIDRCPAGSAGAVGILKDETKKSRRIMPVRKLIDTAGEAVQRFKPVFLMSPLSVAQFLKPGGLTFDLCVIDEASQIRPEDALGAIARCKQLVVVGDDKQLPPTNFFNRMVNDDSPEDDDEIEGAASVKDVESILNLCSRFPERMLKWHYRSEHPALIVTSNRNFYKNELMLPPSVTEGQGDGDTGLVFHKVRDNGYDRGKTATNVFEAEDIAQAALRHAEKYPDQTLGICTFSVAQRDAIRDRLDELSKSHKVLDDFVRRHANGEYLFIRNLENIQGDERDVIFISVGYGRDSRGMLTQQFGPVGRDGGERRLNVLITRQKKRCEVFSSIVAEDIKTEGVAKPGVAALRAFLKLAKDGYADLPFATDKGFDSDFEESVDLVVRSLGYQTRPQVGMAGFFIDIAVIDPSDPGRYILGIECDGAAYHASRYARDRDRLRQTILEDRGWKIHRIWSTDWFYQQDREVQKLKEAIEKATKKISRSDTPINYTVVEEIPRKSNFSEQSAIYFPPSAKNLYVTYDKLAPHRNRYEPHELASDQLANLVVEIVRTEQPIHQDEVARRLSSMFEKQRTGSQIVSAANRGLLQAKQLGLISVKTKFWSMAGDKASVSARDRSVLPAASMLKKPDMISMSEWQAAIEQALVDNLSLDGDELMTETARILGFARIGKDVAAAIKSALKSIQKEKVSTDHMGRYTLAIKEA